MEKRTARTSKKGERLLAKLGRGYSITAACSAERVGRQTYYDWRNEDPEFARAADQAIESGTDLLEDIAKKRATATKDWSDTLLIFLLKARRPNKYKDRLVNEHTGPDGDPLTIIIERVAS